ncbi:MAG: zinc-finger domain-containing protein [Hyphomicrobiales bacterium]
MADAVTPYFHNTDGVEAITIGVKKFMCVGARPPQDHPHVFLDMGDDTEKVCPYCSTLYKYDPELGPTESKPSGMMIKI